MVETAGDKPLDDVSLILITVEERSLSSRLSCVGNGVKSSIGIENKNDQDIND